MTATAMHLMSPKRLSVSTPNKRANLQLGFFLQGQLVVFRALTDFSNASCNVAPVLLNYSDFHIYSKQTRLLTKQSCFVNCELLDCVVVQ